MEKAGYLREALSAGRKDLEHFVELHIEQGGLLEDQEKQVGHRYLYRWPICRRSYLYRPSKPRRYYADVSAKGPDALSCRVYLQAASMGRRIYGRHGLHSGKDYGTAGNANVIPAEVSFTFDIRSAKEERLRQAEAVLLQLKKELEGNIAVEVRVACNEPPVRWMSQA